jgi:hypothetical protein
MSVNRLSVSDCLNSLLRNSSYILGGSSSGTLLKGAECQLTLLDQTWLYGRAPSFPAKVHAGDLMMMGFYNADGWVLHFGPRARIVLSLKLSGSTLMGLD